MKVLLLNDTRDDPNPGCQATVSSLVHGLSSALAAQVTTRPRGDAYEYFGDLVPEGRAHVAEEWLRAVSRLEDGSPLARAITDADLVVANLEGTFHHHTIGALALGGALALAHRAGKRVWAVNGTVEAIDDWLLAETLAQAEYLAVREPRSVRWLRERGLSVTSAADAAFLVEDFVVRGSAHQATKAALYTPGVLAGISASPVDASRLVLADLDALAETGWQPVFLQLEDRESGLAEAARDAGWTTADARAMAWNAFGTYLRRFGLVVSGRYHVLIFAAMAGVPSLALGSNTFKIEGLLELLDRTDTMARDAAELRMLAGGVVPAAVDLTHIRACQELARLNVPAQGY